MYIYVYIYVCIYIYIHRRKLGEIIGGTQGLHNLELK